MNKKIRYILPFLAFLPISSCSVTTTEKETIVNYVQNGGFESADLSGWSVEYGDAYSDDSVSSRNDFYFKGDAKYNQIKEYSINIQKFLRLLLIFDKFSYCKGIKKI